jgi:phage-related minor tail protein
MTELEKQLLHAFEILERQHKEQHSEFVKLYNDLVTRFDQSSEENQRLKSSVSSLTMQVNNLTQQLQQLEKQYSKSNR